jgi:hypothetical protein
MLKKLRRAESDSTYLTILVDVPIGLKASFILFFSEI